MADKATLISKIVSIRNTSTPSSSRISACSMKQSTASSNVMGPMGWSISPSEPRSPATYFPLPQASLASLIPARLTSSVLSEGSIFFNFMADAPNVLAVATSAPALK